MRFSVVHDKNRGAPGKIIIFYVCEIQYRPGEHGTLEFDAEAEQGTSRHADARIQRMAECYLAAQRARRTGFADTTTGNAAAPAASIEADRENHPSGTTAER
jgi:phage-related protein